MTERSPFRYFRTSPEIIRLAAMMYVRFPLSLREVEDILHERGIEVSLETVRLWWRNLGPMFASVLPPCSHDEASSSFATVLRRS